MSRRTITGWLPVVLLVSITFVFLLFWIIRFAVDIPFWDEWALVPYLEKSFQGSLTFSDLFDQHADSRIFFPRLVMIALAHLTGWDTRYEMAAVLVLASFTFLTLAHQCVRTNRMRRQGGRGLWLIIPVSMLVFSVLQRDCWTFGFSLLCHMNIFFVTAGFYLVAAPFSRIRFAGSLLVGLIATYSFANGVFYWVAGPLMLLAGGRMRKTLLAVWIAFAAAVLVPYFIGYQKAPFATPFSFFFDNPLDVAGHFLAFLGAAVVNIPNAPVSLPVAVGAIGVLIFLGGTLACVRLFGMQLKGAGFWIALGTYVLLSSGAAAFGRSVGGIHHALAIRYTIFSGFFWISTIMIASIVLHELGIRFAGRRILCLRAGLLLFGVLCLGLFVESSRHAVRSWEQFYRLQRSIRNELLSFRPDGAVLAYTFIAPIPEDWLDFLIRNELTVFREKRSFADYEVVNLECGHVESAQGDLLPDRIFPGGAFRISGSAHDPEAGGNARAVLLVDSNLVIIARGDIQPDRRSSWTLSLVAGKLPFGVSKIGVYALLRDGSRVSRIGSLVLEKIPLSSMKSAFDLVFVERPDALAGYMDRAVLDADYIRCSGWARNPCLDKPGEWVLVTGQARNPVAYCRVGDERKDVAGHFDNMRMLHSGWHVDFHKGALGAGTHILRSYLLLPDERKALRLNNEFRVIIE